MFLRDPASFRDPDGFVFFIETEVYRGLTGEAARTLKDKHAFYAQAVEVGLLLPFEVSPPTLPSPFEHGHVIRPERVDLISYPHEWAYHQLKEAALVTLDINILALEHGLTLKDASAFNVQLHRGRLQFIDHTSFEPSDGGLPWRPYSQFCRHFLNPLVVGAFRDHHAGSFFRMSLDGLDQQLANDLLPLRAKLVPSIAMHMVLHNRFIKKSAELEKAANAKRRPVGKQVDLLRQLRGFIAGLMPAAAGTTWAHYYENTNYNDETFAAKKSVISRAFSSRALKCVWDVGGNDGTFSRLVRQSADKVLCLDLDHNAVDANYRFNRNEGISDIYPLVYDVGNPTPGLGLRNIERTPLEARSEADAILALAVIHHLSLTNNIPFEQSALFFAERCTELVVEFVGRNDSQVKRLLAPKKVSYDWYDQGHFEAAFAKQFRMRTKTPIEGTERTIYHFDRS